MIFGFDEVPHTSTLPRINVCCRRTHYAESVVYTGRLATYIQYNIVGPTVILVSETPPDPSNILSLSITVLYTWVAGRFGFEEVPFTSI